MRPIVLLLGISATLTILAGLACDPQSKPSELAPNGIPGPPNTSISCPDCEAHSVGRVIAGDTFDLSDGTRVRLYGVDTPERGEACFSEATDRLRQLAGGTVRLENGPRLTDTYGRRLAYAYTSEGLSIDVLLIGEWLAKAWARDGQHRDMLVNLEQSARDNGAGCLW